MDDDDEFFDTISVSSGISRRRFDNKDYLSLSRNTVYQSAIDLETMELTSLNCEEGNSQNKVSRNRDVKTYKQWRDRQWRCFKNSQDSVDFVLAYEKEGKLQDVEKRNKFELHLRNEGLILEKEESQRIQFVKIHVPREVLCKYAAILKLRLPIVNEDEELFVPKPNIIFRKITEILDYLHVTLDPKVFPEKKYRLTAEFSKDKNYLFDVNAPDFFNEGVRITIISYILERGEFGNGDNDKGIRRLISEGIYKAAYPLHNGALDGEESPRARLSKHWARVSKFVKYQPIDEIKDYFGVKFALYFTWLGFYTHMLIPASIVGILCLVYAALSSDTLSHDLCHDEIIMCPRCDKVCDYWKLSDGCMYSKIQHFIDNPATIFFAVFMSFWSVLYLELWKRYSAEIMHRWGLTGFDLLAEPPRPEYLIRLSDAKKQKLNIITKLDEPAVSYWKVKLPSLVLSFAIALLWVFIALAVVFGVVIYRMSLITSEVLYKDRVSYRIYILPCTAGIINLFCIMVLNEVYRKLAKWLTEMELQRTQTEYDDSIALKIYMFQFVNYYSSIFYVAFIKGKFVGYPAKYNRIFGIRQEECNPGGCLMEVTIQLAIIMIGNQFLNAVTEMAIPLLFKLYNGFKIKTGLKKTSSDEHPIIICNQWTEDYKLLEYESQSLLSEYLEMVLQYGFVTLFVTAFPLAPLFALINNVLEMRLDAKKFLKYFRRPVPQRVKNIGVWLPVMAIVGRISVVSNAFIIAFSSHFVPKLVYTMQQSLDGTEHGFLNFTLAFFNTSDFESGTAPENSQYNNITICRFSEYRNSYNASNLGLPKYKRPLIYWHILAAQLAFVVAYQNIVTFVVTAVEWTIPDIPRKLNDQIKRESYVTIEKIIRHEKERTRARRRNTENRGSVLSSETVYYDANGGFLSDLMNTPSSQVTVADHDAVGNSLT